MESDKTQASPIGTLRPNHNDFAGDFLFGGTRDGFLLFGKQVAKGVELYQIDPSKKGDVVQLATLTGIPEGRLTLWIEAGRTIHRRAGED